MADVRADRGEANVQFTGDVFVSDAFGQTIQNHLFARGQMAKFIVFFGGLKRRNYFAGNEAGHRTAAFVYFLDRFQQFFGRQPFQ